MTNFRSCLPPSAAALDLETEIKTTEYSEYTEAKQVVTKH